MALTIDNATQGFDVNGIQSLIGKLKLKMVTEVIAEMNTGVSKLEWTVDSGWVGTSAETFKSNMQADKETISKALEESQEQLKAYLFDIGNRLDEMDASLVEKRGD